MIDESAFATPWMARTSLLDTLSESQPKNGPETTATVVETA
jgi:hypothetical protein